MTLGSLSILVETISPHTIRLGNILKDMIAFLVNKAVSSAASSGRHVHSSFNLGVRTCHRLFFLCSKLQQACPKRCLHVLSTGVDVT